MPANRPPPKQKPSNRSSLKNVSKVLKESGGVYLSSPAVSKRTEPMALLCSESSRCSGVYLFQRAAVVLISAVGLMSRALVRSCTSPWVAAAGWLLELLVCSCVARV